ncbi:glycerophosphodiester phosphodiesterase family protein [Hyphomonadaceae bacterium BL14]|nr:glycerophosphodiester phosphodiesterase family protein [Hyphomonadaceae bacterium BL14]
MRNPCTIGAAAFRRRARLAFTALAAAGLFTAGAATLGPLSTAAALAAHDEAGGHVAAPRWPAPGEVIIVAHRACWSAAPENSVAAVDHCRRIGVEAIEIDVQLTRDGELVVFHDRGLERMTNGSGQLSDFTLEELRRLYLKERDGVGSDITGYPFLTRHRIPLLSEVFQATGSDILINLEIKSNERWTFEDTFRRAVEVAFEAGAEPQVFWKIPAPRRGGGTAQTPADAVYRSLPMEGLTMAAPLIWRSERSFETQLADFAGHNVSIFELVTDDVDYWPVDEDGRIFGADETIYMGVSILPQWGGALNDERALRDPDVAWGGMIDLGIRMIMTDRPEQLRVYLDGRGATP